MLKNFTILKNGKTIDKQGNGGTKKFVFEERNDFYIVYAESMFEASVIVKQEINNHMWLERMGI